MRWMLEDVRTEERLDKEFDTQNEARSFLTRMGPVLSERLAVIAVAEKGDNPDMIRMLSEGLVRGDLRDILLPRLSIDEYVSADPEADNVVIAFFIKGVPEAVLPLKNFCEHCEGVSLSDYASSETIENCTIVYAEMDRPTLKVKNIEDMLEQVCVVADMKPDDFTLTFPNTQRKYPYDPGVMEKYFQYRSEEQSKKAQELALNNNDGEVQPEPEVGDGEKMNEAAIIHMASLFGDLPPGDLKSISVL